MHDVMLGADLGRPGAPRGPGAHDVRSERVRMHDVHALVARSRSIQTTIARSECLTEIREGARAREPRSARGGQPRRSSARGPDWA